MTDKREKECWNDKTTHVVGDGVTKKAKKIPDMMKNCPILGEQKKGLLTFVIYYDEGKKGG